MKRCGKSAPRRRQRWRQGKPHREQDQVGAAGAATRSAAPGGPPRRRSGRSHEAPGNGCPRGMAITVPGGCRRGGTEPGLHAVWRLLDGGCFGGSRGDKCGFRGTTVWISELAVARRARPRRLAAVWSIRGLSRPWTRDRSEAGVREAPHHTKGGRRGRSDRVARSFFGWSGAVQRPPGHRPRHGDFRRRGSDDDEMTGHHRPRPSPMCLPAACEVRGDND